MFNIQTPSAANTICYIHSKNGDVMYSINKESRQLSYVKQVHNCNTLAQNISAIEGILSLNTEVGCPVRLEDELAAFKQAELNLFYSYHPTTYQAGKLPLGWVDCYFFAEESLDENGDNNHKGKSHYICTPYRTKEKVVSTWRSYDSQRIITGTLLDTVDYGNKIIHYILPSENLLWVQDNKDAKNVSSRKHFAVCPYEKGEIMFKASHSTIYQCLKGIEYSTELLDA